MGIIKRCIYGLCELYFKKRNSLSESSSAILFSKFIGDYKKYPFFKTYKIHKKGYSVDDWCFLGLSNDNYKEYLSSMDYWKMHPINGTYSKWIDDKLTLKYICSGTELDKYMPEYYYMIDESGNFYSLMDLPEYNACPCPSDVAELLKQKGTLAIKLIAGSIGKGFIKGEYKDDSYYLNGEKYDLNEFCKKVGTLRNYIITEYLRPHNELAQYCPETVNCLRYLIGRVDGKTQMLKSFIRFGTKRSGFVENYNAGGVLCYVNENGNVTEGNIIDRKNNCNVVVFEHPDNHKKLQLTIPLWDEIVKAGELFGVHLPQMKYLGIDFVITNENKLKVLEVNSLTSLDSIQLDCSILNTKAAGFFKNLL